MTDDDEQKAVLAEQLRARLARPIPARVLQEMALALCIDHLGASLDLARQALAAAEWAANDAVASSHGSKVATPAMATSWAASLAELGAAFGQVESDGLATILSVRTLLQV